MRTKKSMTRKQRSTIKEQNYETIIEDVQDFEELGRRMQELVATSPKGTRIYLRVRNPVIIH